MKRKRSKPLSSEKALAKIRKLVTAGKVAFDIPPMLDTPIKVNKREFSACTLGGTFKHKDGEGFEIRWAIKGFGFGSLTFVRRPDGSIECDDETLGRKFASECLAAFLHRTRLYSERKNG
jgi:hypothetical protein